MELITEWLDLVALEYDSYILTWRNVLSFVLFLMIMIQLHIILYRHFISYYFKIKGIDNAHRKVVHRRVLLIYVLFTFIGTVRILNIDINLMYGTPYALRFSTIFTILIFIYSGRLIDFFLNKIILADYFRSASLESGEESASSKSDSPSGSVQLSVYLLVIIWSLNYFNLDFEIYPSISTSDGSINFYISNLLFAVLIIILARLFAWALTHLILLTYYKRKNVDQGTRFAINQLVKYVIYIVAFVIVISSFGIEVTVLLGGAAALLVGIGLGLQQTFNDLISGIIILFERSVEVGDVIEIDSMVGIVQKIGLRTSRVETRDNINVIVPNSKLIVNNMINWSHFDDKARFALTIGVAYGSDTEMVKRLLIDVSKKNPYVLEYPTPNVMFRDFGDSALIFHLMFWSRNFMLIEAVKSDLRYEIDKVFREYKINIPFPQQDLWIKEWPQSQQKQKEEAKE